MQGFLSIDKLRKYMSDYNEQLSMAFESMSGVTPAHSRWSIPPSETRQEGNTTVYENFKKTIEILNRDADAVLKFLQNEFGTSATIDDIGRARFTGEFSTTRIDLAVNSFSIMYVICPQCDLPDTQLKTENDSTTLHCEACGSLSQIN